MSYRRSIDTAASDLFIAQGDLDSDFSELNGEVTKKILMHPNWRASFTSLGIALGVGTFVGSLLFVAYFHFIFHIQEISERLSAEDIASVIFVLIVVSFIGAFVIGLLIALLPSIFIFVHIFIVGQVGYFGTVFWALWIIPIIYFVPLFSEMMDAYRENYLHPELVVIFIAVISALCARWVAGYMAVFDKTEQHKLSRAR